MKVTVRIKCPQRRTLQRDLEDTDFEEINGRKLTKADFEIKGPFYSGNVVTFLASITGEIIASLSKQYVEVQVSPSDYSKCEERGFTPIF
jgi:hypothetical protein